MSDFTNRITAQRNILSVLNKLTWEEDLFGLSHGAINRWVSINQLDPESSIVKLIEEAARKLFFLANKSQEQITEEYRSLSAEVTSITSQIKDSVNALKSKSSQ